MRDLNWTRWNEKSAEDDRVFEFFIRLQNQYFSEYLLPDRLEGYITCKTCSIMCMMSQL